MQHRTNSTIKSKDALFISLWNRRTFVPVNNPNAMPDMIYKKDMSVKKMLIKAISLFGFLYEGPALQAISLYPGKNGNRRRNPFLI
jgi:hypothetical protein